MTGKRTLYLAIMRSLVTFKRSILVNESTSQSKGFRARMKVRKEK
jgi:hypothetical protein